MNHVEKCGEHLKNPLLLAKIVEEVQKEGVVGEEDTTLALILKIMLRYTKNADATSSNIVVSDKSGGGKDFLVKSICKVMIKESEYFHRTGLTEQIFRYWHANKNDFTWTGKVIHLEDPSEDLIKSQGFKTMASGGSNNTVVKDQKAVDLKVNGKPVIIVTSFNTNIDIEGIRRWDAIRMDTSKQLTESVIKYRMLEKACMIKTNKDKELREALQSLIAPNDVVIPFIDCILKILPSTLPMRTISGKFIDYIKASAILHQFQREKNEEGYIIATWFDYEYARFVFMKTVGKHGVPLSSSEEAFMDVLIQSRGKPLSVTELSERFNERSKSWIYKNIVEQDKFKATGLIREIQEWDERSNKDIVKYYTDLDEINLAIPPSWFWNEEGVLEHENSTTKNMEKNTPQKVGFVMFSENVIYINNIRLKRNLNNLKNLNSFSFSFHNKTNNNNNIYKEKVVVEKSIPDPYKTVQNTTSHMEKNTIPKPNLFDKIKELSSFIEKNRKAGYSITYNFLINNFSTEFINNCIENGVIYNNGDEYLVNY